MWIAGYPSLYGGADTELDHNINLLRKYGVEVHLVPMFGYDPKMRLRCDELGCKTHEYKADVFKDRIALSYCNENFLEKFPEIVKTGRPEKVIWFNCMTWTFEKELEAHRRGWIDYFGFVSEYQKKCLLPALQKKTAVQVFEGYKPYYSVEDTTFRYKEPGEHFKMGRISRDDGGKFSSDMWNIFHKVNSPIPTKTFILGWGENAKEKCGEPPAGLDWATYAPGSMPIKKFYHNLDCIIHKTGGSRESYCRIVPEAYAHGVPIIVEDDYAFPELVIDGETGFRCKSSEEMSYRASQLAFDEKLRKDIIYNAYEYLKKNIANKEMCWSAWERILVS